MSEAWREPLGALRITLWDDNPPELQIDRTRDEVERLCGLLNGVTEGSEGMVRMKDMGVVE